MRLTLIDWLAWELIKFAALFQGVIFNALLPHAKSDKDFFKWMQYALSGFFISQIGINDLPDIARKKLLSQGKILLGVFTFSLAIGIIRKLFE